MSIFDSAVEIVAPSRGKSFDPDEQAQILTMLNKSRTDHTLYTLTLPDAIAPSTAAAIKFCANGNDFGLSFGMKDNKDGTRTITFGGRAPRQTAKRKAADGGQATLEEYKGVMEGDEDKDLRVS